MLDCEVISAAPFAAPAPSVFSNDCSANTTCGTLGISSSRSNFDGSLCSGAKSTALSSARRSLKLGCISCDASGGDSQVPGTHTWIRKNGCAGLQEPPGDEGPETSLCPCDENYLLFHECPYFLHFLRRPSIASGPEPPKTRAARQARYRRLHS